MKFYCREQELKKMQQRYDADKFECIVIYGRRRVGKTALINKFCEDKKTVSFSALNAPGKDNLRALSKAIYMCKHDDAESFPEYRSFDEALAEITRMSKEERIVFVIDEYPYLAKADSSISSRLQHLIDHIWCNTDIYVILCGSSMSFMQNQVLGYESPLYGRRTAQFKIMPLTYKETAVFNPDLTDEENALVYGITGGIPHYINNLDVRGNIDEALKQNLFDTSAYLFEEPQNLLEQELREPAVYNSIVTAVAEGASKLGEISTKSGISTAACNKYISVLMELGFIVKETPMMEKGGKKTLYRLDDEFFKFWYRFVPQNMSIIAADKMSHVYDKAVKPHLHDYMRLVFEKMCREYLMRYEENPPFIISEIGQWWGTDSKTRKEVQIDIVANSIKDGTKSSNEYIIGSCKFKNVPIGLEELDLLKQYSSVFGKGEKYYYYIFSLGGFTEGLRKAEKEGAVRLITLDDMYR